MKAIPKAFTIIELLIVVSIISLLAAAVIVSYAGQRLRARDSRRKADWNTIERTLAAYYTDNFIYSPEITCDSSYGSDSDSGCPPAGNGASNPLGQWDQASVFYQSLVPQYISNLPVDPLNTTTYFYEYEPSNNPARQCFIWRFWTEYGGKTLVEENIGDLKDANGILQPTCNF